MRTAALLFAPILALSAVPLLVSAQTPPTGTAPPATSAGTAAPAPSAEAPVPVPPASAKALRYYRSGNLLWAVDLLWGLAVPALLLWTGFSARLRTWAQRLGRRWFFVVVLYFTFFSLLTTLLDLPLAFYEGFVRQHAYGLSNQTLAKWVSDSLKELVVGTVVGALTIWLPFLLLKHSPRRWWLYTGLMAAPFLALVLLVSPVWIDPLFNHFGPMKDKALEARILALAGRAGISGSRVYEVDKSADTETVNAYVAGLAGTKRIVVWDTTFRKLEPREILTVVGHEMGHYVLGHVPILIALGSGLILLGLYVIHRTARGLIGRYGPQFGFTELADVASLPLILLLFSLTSLVASPFVLGVSRHLEHEADRFGLEVTRDNHAMASAFAKLQHENLDNPRPGRLYKVLRASHPPLGERIDFCNTYRPWEAGQPLRYGTYIRPAP
ncbi:MAG TPA: M48 family metallopeptidase [Thermoanaerobaculia bacterium]|nr:M48 family metallopeptidase [Thermoanaerobaculia bacterium]